MEQLALILLCVFGSVLAAYLKWGESDAAFDRKVVIALVRAAVAGLVSAFAFQGVVAVFPWTYLTAFLAGMGIEVLSGPNTVVGDVLGL